MKKLFLCFLIFISMAAHAFADSSYDVKASTDEKFPVVLLDDTDGKAGETSKTYSDTTIGYSCNGDNSWTSYTDDADTFKEVGNGVYWLTMGASEFTSVGQRCIIRVSVSGALDYRFDISVQTSAPDEIVQAINSILVDTGTTLDTAISNLDSKTTTIDGVVDSILEDTGTSLPATLATANSKTDVIDGIVDSILEDTGTDIPASLAATDSAIAVIDGIADAILEDTGTTIPGTLATINTVADEILADTGTTLPASLAGIDSKIDTISISAADIWDYDVSSYTDAGKAGTYLKGAGSAGDPWSSALPGAYGIGTAGYIVGTFIDESISGIDDNPWDNGTRTLTAGTKDSEIDAILEDTGTTLPDTLSNIDTKLTTAQSDLDNVNQYKADVSALALEATIANVDSIVDSILEDTGTTLQDALDSIDSQLDVIEGNSGMGAR